MLEDPSYDSIVRWGENGESFVVLEVRDPPPPAFAALSPPFELYFTYTSETEREVHQNHPAETLQAQQLRQFCAPAK